MSGPFVLDASLAAAWLFPDEVTPATEFLRGRAADSHVLVPAIFPIEMQNILWTGEKRKRLTFLDSEAFWLRLARLDIRVQQAEGVAEHPALLPISRQFGLSAYDASYLTLARSAVLPMATLDSKLRAVGRATGLEILS